MASVIRRSAMNRIVANLEGVKTSVYNRAVVIASKAYADLRSHYYEGESSISVERHRTDTFVYLVDPWAASIEFGHWSVSENGVKWVRGLYIISRAAGIM
jgi:hypothetical protein